MTITDAIVTTGFKWAFKEYFTTKNKIEKKSNHVLLKKNNMNFKLQFYSRGFAEYYKAKTFKRDF